MSKKIIDKKIHDDVLKLQKMIIVNNNFDNFSMDLLKSIEVRYKTIKRDDLIDNILDDEEE